MFPAHIVPSCQQYCSMLLSWSQAAVRCFTMTCNIGINNINIFCDWLSETTMLSVYDLLFKSLISIVLFSYWPKHSSCSYRYVATQILFTSLNNVVPTTYLHPVLNDL